MPGTTNTKRTDDMTIQDEIQKHLSNPDREEGESNLALLVAQEIGSAKDRQAKAEEIQNIIANTK